MPVDESDRGSESLGDAESGSEFGPATEPGWSFEPTATRPTKTSPGEPVEATGDAADHQPTADPGHFKVDLTRLTVDPTHQYDPGSGAPSAGRSATRRKNKPVLLGAAAFVVVVVAVVIGVVASSGGGPSAPGTGMAPADFVVASTHTTLAQRSADLTIDGSIVEAGQTVPIHGSGWADFDTNQYSANMNVDSGSYSMDEHELVTGGQLFIGMDVNGTSMSILTGGPNWVSVPVPDQGSSALGAGNIDPLSQLQMMEKKGATVQPLGTSTVNGITVSGYAVTPSRAEELQKIQQEINSGAIPRQFAKQALGAVNSLGNLTTDVYFDQSGLLRKESVQVGGGTSGANGTVAVVFSAYGTPRNVQTPAPSDVVSMSQFLKDAMAFGGSHA
jgi:hypothetical protein